MYGSNEKPGLENSGAAISEVKKIPNSPANEKMDEAM
jgi:hypothetical protein